MPGQRQARRDKRPPRPLTPDSLRSLALHYVGRYATSSGKLIDYLKRKLRERGWTEDDPPSLEDLVQSFAEAGYIDDAGYASARKSSLLRRGYGPSRVRQALRHAGVGAEIAAAEGEIEEDVARQAAVDFARRKRLGPFARDTARPIDPDRAIAAMIRAGHPYALAREILGSTNRR